MNSQVPQMPNGFPNGTWPVTNGQGGPAAPNNAFNQPQLQGANGQLLPPSTPLQQNMQPSNAPTLSNRLMPQSLPPCATPTPMQLASAGINGTGSPNLAAGMAGSPSSRPESQMQQGMSLSGQHPQMPMQGGRPTFPAMPASSFLTKAAQMRWSPQACTPN